MTVYCNEYGMNILFVNHERMIGMTLSPKSEKSAIVCAGQPVNEK